jgi:hypothetical protein
MDKQEEAMTRTELHDLVDRLPASAVDEAARRLHELLPDMHRFKDFKEALLAMPDLGEDSDFERPLELPEDLEP